MGEDIYDGAYMVNDFAACIADLGAPQLLTYSGDRRFRITTTLGSFDLEASCEPAFDCYGFTCVALPNAHVAPAYQNAVIPYEANRASVAIYFDVRVIGSLVMAGAAGERCLDFSHLPQGESHIPLLSESEAWQAIKFIHGDIWARSVISAQATWVELSGDPITNATLQGVYDSNLLRLLTDVPVRPSPGVERASFTPAFLGLRCLHYQRLLEQINRGAR